MSDKIYRIVVDEESYCFDSDSYDHYVARAKQEMQGPYSASMKLLSPEELRKVHIDNAWGTVKKKTYTNPVMAERYIKSLKWKHFWFLDFYIEETELNWRRYGI